METKASFFLKPFAISGSSVCILSSFDFHTKFHGLWTLRKTEYSININNNNGEFRWNNLDKI